MTNLWQHTKNHFTPRLPKCLEAEIQAIGRRLQAGLSVDSSFDAPLHPLDDMAYIKGIDKHQRYIELENRKLWDAAYAHAAAF